MPNYGRQAMKSKVTTLLHDRRVERYDHMRTERLPRSTNIVHHNDQSTAVHENTVTFLPDLPQRCKEVLVVVNCTQLPTPLRILF